MKKIQWSYLKILLIVAISSFLTTNQAFSQISHHRLRKADSLFHAKQYTQSLDHYRELLKSRQYSSAMLLKMAFIEEGLHQIGEALYYLNLYFLETRDKSALDKMEELAVKYNLKGYSTTQSDSFASLYNDFHSSISLALAVLIVFSLSLAVYLKRKKQRPVAIAWSMFGLVILLIIHSKLGNQFSAAIITAPTTYLMSGPSAGASVVSVIHAGHRVEVTGKEDVWLKIKWDGKPVYIKENNLLPVSL